MTKEEFKRLKESIDFGFTMDLPNGMRIEFTKDTLMITSARNRLLKTFVDNKDAVPSPDVTTVTAERIMITQTDV
jgi:hypothetical protein